MPRDQWQDGKINRGFDGYASWAAEVAQATQTSYIDLNKRVADRLDELGQAKAHLLYNDAQHTKKTGARLNAECVVAGLKSLPLPTLQSALLP